MNTLVISDLHAHTAWPFSKPGPDGRPSRFADLLNVLAQVMVELNRDPADDLIIAGDLTHRRHFISFTLYNDLMAHVAGLARLVKRTHILVGNHDYETEETHSLYPFGYLPNTTVYEEPALAKLYSGEDVMMIPYLHDAGRVVQAFEQAPAVPVFSHYAAEGVPLNEEYWLDSPVKLDMLTRFPFVVFGHIHPPTEQLEGRVHYVGAPMHFTFGDSGPRYFTRLRGWDMLRKPLSFPVFQTARWPRIPKPAARGYLRVLDVPARKLAEVKEAALAIGWMDAVALEEALPPEVREAISSGLVVDEPLLKEYVRRRCPDLSEEEQFALVAAGMAFLKEARG